MKTYLISGLLLAAFTVFTSCGTDEGISINEIPTDVVDDFDSRHANSSGIKWEKEGNYYEAEFTENGVEKEIVYDLDGNWVQTECEISLDDVPQAANDYIAANYPEAKIEEAESINRAEGDFVEVEIQDGKNERELLFDTSGNFIEEVIEDDHDDEDDDD